MTTYCIRACKDMELNSSTYCKDMESNSSTEYIETNTGRLPNEKTKKHGPHEKTGKNSIKKRSK